MDERHKLSVMSLVVGGTMVGLALGGRWGLGSHEYLRWPWLFGSALVVLGIALFAGALRANGGADDADTLVVADAGIPSQPFEFQEHEPSQSDDAAE